MVFMLDLNGLYHGFEPQSGQSMTMTLVFNASDIQAALRSKSNDGLARNWDNVSDMSTRGLLD
jgi:hypothetical protein